MKPRPFTSPFIRDFFPTNCPTCGHDTAAHIDADGVARPCTVCQCTREMTVSVYLGAAIQALAAAKGEVA